jgi:hypothetical protein
MITRFGLPLVIASCLSASACGQCFISGKVMEANTGEALAGITVTLKQGSSMAYTDRNGSFTLPCSCKGGGILLAEGIGFHSQELAFYNRKKKYVLALYENESDWLNRVVLISSETLKK